MAEADRQQSPFGYFAVSPAIPEGPYSPSSKRSAAPLPWITSKDFFWLLYLYPGRWVSRISNKLLRVLLWCVGPVFQRISMPAQQVLEKRLATAFGTQMPVDARKQTARNYISNSIRRLADDLALANGNAHMNCRSFVGREHLDSALAAGRGIILTSLHWHSTRVALRHLKNMGYPVMVVRNRYPRDRRMGRLGQKFLQPRYIELLHKVIQDEVYIQDPECSLKILARLRANGIVNIHLDVPFSRQLLNHSFLRQTMAFPVGPLHIARISGCAVLPLLTIGHSGSLEIQIGQPFIFDRSLPAEEYCLRHLPAISQTFELYVSQYPDQWELWIKL